MGRGGGAVVDKVRNKIVGAVIREVRQDAGLSLAKIEQATGGHPKASVLGAYERGERTVSVERLVELAEMYHTSPGMVLLVIEQRCSSVAALSQRR